MSHRSKDDKIALFITKYVGSMWCAYLFTIFSLVALPQAIETHSLTVLINWASSNFLQLVLLPIILVSGNKQSEKMERMEEKIFQMEHNHGEQLTRILDLLE